MTYFHYTDEDGDELRVEQLPDSGYYAEAISAEGKTIRVGLPYEYAARLALGLPQAPPVLRSATESELPPSTRLTLTDDTLGPVTLEVMDERGRPMYELSAAMTGLIREVYAAQRTGDEGEPDTYEQTIEDAYNFFFVTRLRELSDAPDATPETLLSWVESLVRQSAGRSQALIDAPRWGSYLEHIGKILGAGSMPYDSYPTLVRNHMDELTKVRELHRAEERLRRTLNSENAELSKQLTAARAAVAAAHDEQQRLQAKLNTAREGLGDALAEFSQFTDAEGMTDTPVTGVVFGSDAAAKFHASMKRALELSA